MKMKIYNISDTKGFFKRLAGCAGQIELVEGDGTHIVLDDQKYGDGLGLLARTYTDGTIRELELCFTDSADAVNVMQYLAAVKAA